MRLDVFLYEKGLAKSRTEAKNLIAEGAVLHRGKAVLKPAYEIDEGDTEVLLNRERLPYASRGGVKLDGALAAFSLDPTGADCIDVGASSGGFTDCLLQHGARRVIALDSGRDQLVPKLRGDPRVISLEGYNARYMEGTDFPFVPSFAVMDVSFISATLIIPALYRVLSPVSDFVCLVKPQFEVGRANIGKGGIVKDERARREALSRVIAFAEEIGFVCKGTAVSPIAGGDGNVEYLVHFRKEESV